MGNDSPIEQYVSSIAKLLSKTRSDEELYASIVNAPFQNKLHSTTLDLGIIVLLVVDKKAGTVDRVAWSDTEPARWAAKSIPIPIKKIKIPLENKTNIIVKAIKTKRPQKTSDWRYLFNPVLTAVTARFNQAEAGMACSFVYPLSAITGGAIIFSYYQPLENISTKHERFMQSYSKIVENSLSK